MILNVKLLIVGQVYCEFGSFICKHFVDNLKKLGSRIWYNLVKLLRLIFTVSKKTRLSNFGHNFGKCGPLFRTFTVRLQATT